MTRRTLTAALPLLTMAATKGQNKPEKLQSKAYPLESLTKKGKGRQVLDGLTHTGYEVDMHITELAPGEAPHPPHRHAHEEMIFIEQGTMEVTIEGKSTRIGPGGSAYVASNDFHGWKNVGDRQARYFVLALGRTAS